MRERFDTDVAVVGGGVVGCAIARELSGFELRLTLLEAGPDVGAGTSKANTALLHTGFDAKPGTLEARLVARGYELLGAYAERVGIPVERTGALLVAWDEEQVGELPGILSSGARERPHDLRELGGDELYAREPSLGPGARGAIAVPGEGLVARSRRRSHRHRGGARGCDLRRSTPVTRASRLDGGGFRLATPGGELTARYLVNAAGLHSDELDRMLGHDGFTVTPRRGELIVFDKLARPLVQQIVLAVPTKVTKGVLIAPTVFGNVMLGRPLRTWSGRTTRSRRAGLDHLMAEERADHARAGRARGHRRVRGPARATEHADYQLTVHAPRATRAWAESARPACRPRWRSRSTCARSWARPGCARAGPVRRRSSGCRTSGSGASGPTSAAS